MTSTPVSVGTRNYFQNQMPTAVSSGGDTTNSFSEVLKNQRSEQRTENEKTPVDREKQYSKSADGTAKTARDVVRADSKEIATDEAALPVQDAVEKAASEMLEKTADELEISVEELMEILNSLCLTPMELLQPENLQAVVLEAAGETDVCSLVTDEQLFQTLQCLNDMLEDTVEEIAQATGKEPEEVQQLLAGFAGENAQDTAETVLVEQKPEASGEEKTYRETKKQSEPQQTQTTAEAGQDGGQIMLERSMSASTGQGSEQRSGADTQSMPAQVQTVQLQTQEAVQTAETVPTAHFDADTELILQQITDYMKGQITEGVSELEMQLHPESLGNLHIRLTAKEGTLTAHFTAQNETVKAALESQMIQLKETFREQGVTVEAIEVTVQSHRFDQQYSGGSSSAKEDGRQPGRQARRRINLNLPEEELAEEDQLAAEMLRESGGTVDYTA